LDRFAAFLILFTPKTTPPPHGKLIRLAVLASFVRLILFLSRYDCTDLCSPQFLATLYSCDTLVLYVLLNSEGALSHPFLLFFLPPD
jgi:hypothetical protein